MNNQGSKPARSVSSSRGRLFSRALAILAALLVGAGSAALGVCGPFTDVSDAAFCPFVLEIFTLGITTGTSPTTYDPAGNVSRLQMAAFLSRTVDGVLERGSRRTAMRQLWTAKDASALPMTTMDTVVPYFVEFDGADLWVGEPQAGRLARVRASDGKLLETWTGVLDLAGGIVFAMGKVIVATEGISSGLTGRLMQVDPSLPAGAASTVATGLPRNSFALAFDGGRFWTANQDGTVSIVTPGATLPWTVTTTASGYQSPQGILYDGTNIWITDNRDSGLDNGNLLKLNGSGGVLQTVTVGNGPFYPVFDGANFWVPNESSDSVSVVRASSGVVLATLTGNGVFTPIQAAFDGQRVLVTDANSSAVSLWKAADLTPLGTFSMPGPGFSPHGVTSDGASFWITLSANSGPGRLVRF